MRTFYQNHKLIIVFLLRALGIYLLWYILYNSLIYKNHSIDTFLIQHLIGATSFILKTIGFTIFTKTDLIGIVNSSGLIVSPPCDGLSLFVLFAGFIMAYPGRLKSKFVFIPIGLLIIDLINIIRIVSLVMIAKYSPKWLEFNHSYTFTLIMYVIIFFMWMWWVRGAKGESEESGVRSQESGVLIENKSDELVCQIKK
jgi:exosortase/archaeosortase family protein